jgi:O-antigen ligase
VATVAATMERNIERKPARNSLAYNALLLFTFLYYTRPEDLIPTLGFFPLEKIIGGVAFLALISTLASRTVKRKLPLELKLLFLLFIHLAISIPFAYWRGGAFVTVFERFYKGVTVGFLVTLVVENFDQLRRLLWVQAASMVATTFASLALHRTDAGRLIGALGGIFENPNDLAINIAINWPLCLAFVLLARSATKRAIWVIGILSMLLAVVLTYSRSGLVATVAAILMCLWEFGVRGKRMYLIGAAFFLALGAGVVVFATPHYLLRVESIFRGNVRGSEDNGSLEARKELLYLSVEEAIHHPIFGIGAGNFAAATKTWHVTHNTYMEFASEGGFPALFIFLAILYLTFRNLKKMELLPVYRQRADVRILADAMWASLAAFMIGAMFASYEYELFPYFMVAYASVFYRWCVEASADGAQPEEVKPKRLHWQRVYGTKEAWKR